MPIYNYYDIYNATIINKTYLNPLDAKLFFAKLL